MTPEDSKILIEALESVGAKPRSYSGRGMFGKSCVAVSLNSDNNLSEWYIAQELVREGDSVNPGAPRHDEMGLGTIIYWPNYPWPESMKDNDTR